MAKGKVTMSGSGFVEDVRIGVRLKISVLWIAMLFLFAYAFEHASARDQILADRFTRGRKPYGVDKDEYAELDEHDQR